MSQAITLNKENIVEYIKAYVSKGFQFSKTMTIGDGAVLHKIFNFLNKKIEDSELTIEKAYDTIFRTIDVSNKEGAFSIDDASVIDVLVKWVNENVLIKKEQEPTVNGPSSITEL